MRKPVYKPIHLRPASMLLDTRSTPDEVGLNGFRWVESWELNERARMCRMSGYRHFLADAFTNNADLHNQLLSLAGDDHVRQPINLLYEATQASGAKKLFVGTQNRLYALNNSTGNYKIIADLYGGTPVSGWSDRVWWATDSNDIVVFTNGVDKPLYHVIDQPIEDAGQSVAVIPDLEKLKVSAVGFVITWNHLTFYCNVVQDGVRASFRVLWSDYDKPISLVPKKDASLAGSFDMDLSEVILNAAPMGNTLLIYTNLGVWQCSVGGTSVSFLKRYSPKRPNDGVLFYPRTLVSSGSEHYFFGIDGLYVYSYYIAAPERVDWIHRASAIVFEDIDDSRCMVHCAGYEPAKRQLFFFWAKTGQDVPQQGITINTETDFASLVPFGATCVGNFGFTSQLTLRDWMIEHCICTPDELAFEKEGGYCVAQPVVDCPTPPASFYSNDALDLDGDDIENIDAAEADDDSLCAQLGDLTVQELCEGEQGGACKLIDTCLFADGSDLCLKAFDKTVYYRERCTGFTDCGSYTRLGYRSPLASGALHFDLIDDTKWITFFGVEAIPALQTVPSKITAKLGTAAQAHDPNTAGNHCVILYENLEPRELKCLSDKDADALKQANVRPDETLAWKTYMPGSYLYFGLDVVNDRVSPEDTGGAVCLSRITMHLQIGV